MKKYLVITNNENYYLINVISSLSAAKKLTSYLLKKTCITLDEVFELIKNSFKYRFVFLTLQRYELYFNLQTF